MSTSMKVEQNTGIISLGDHARNTVVQNAPVHPDTVDWEKLEKEIERLKASADDRVKKFAEETAEPVGDRDMGRIKAALLRWLPCVGGLIEASYYTLEIAARLGIPN